MRSPPIPKTPAFIRTSPRRLRCAGITRLDCEPDIEVIIALLKRPDYIQSVAKRKKRRGHFCRICKCYLPNERFSGKGHATHICKNCQRMPKAERFHIEAMDRMWDFLFWQRHISEKNIAQLAQFAEAEDPKVSQFASVVLELARLRPHRRKRYRGLRRTHPELLRRLIEVGILDDYGPYEDQMAFLSDPEEMGLHEDEEERRGLREIDSEGSEALEDDLPF